MADLSPPPACRLDAAGRRDQAERYRRLRANVAAMRRGDDMLDVAFDAAVDLALLRETVAVEQACCPFFDLRLDDAARTLRAAVAEPEDRPALDALAAAIDPKEPSDA